MIESIKREMTIGKIQDHVEDCLLESFVTQDIKDALLDSVEMDIEGIGAENDSEINTLLDLIPEYEEEDPTVEAELESLTESLIESQI